MRQGEPKKNYYRVLGVSPEAEPREITAAYKRLAELYQHLLSVMPNVSEYAERMADINEAYGVLSDPVRRAAYRSFEAEPDAQEAEDRESLTEEIARSMELLAQEMAKRRRRKYLRLPRSSRMVQRVVLVTAIVLLLMVGGGTSLAFAKPEHTLAAPFRGVAITATEASGAAVSLIVNIRRVVASYECNIVSRTLQSMRVIEGLSEVPAVTVPTNDMACFPSTEHCLFPDYLDREFSQFKYTVDHNGIVSVDTSGAITDALLARIEQLLRRLSDRK